MTATSTCLPSIALKEEWAKIVSRACLGLIRGSARWTGTSSCVSSSPGARRGGRSARRGGVTAAARLPAHVAGGLSEEAGLRGREKRSHAATLGRLLKRLEEEAPSKGTGKGSKSRYRIHLSNRSGPYGQPKGRGQSRSPRNGGRSSAGSRQRQLPQDQQRQQQEPALWMAARAGDTDKCQQLLAARAEVDVRLKSWDLLSLVTTLERQKPSAWRLEAPWQPTKMQLPCGVRPLILTWRRPLRMNF